MAFINWGHSLIVNIGTIDSQHQRLIAIVNDLFDAMSEGKGNEILGEIFVELIDYTKSHFSTEESLMKIHAYPYIKEHKEQHDELTKQALDLYDKFRAGQGTVSVPVLNFLRTWLNNHILSTDKKLGAYLESKGVR